jgi:hypothetical protein
LPTVDVVRRVEGIIKASPTIEQKRRWLTQRCLTGETDGRSSTLNVEYRYAPRMHARNTWKTRFTGTIAADQPGTILTGTVDYR